VSPVSGWGDTAFRPETELGKILRVLNIPLQELELVLAN
jgi:hypothetical protein